MKIDIGIDTGGTYTDAVAFDAQSRQILGWSKALTTKEDLSIGIGGALDGLPRDLPGQARMVSLSTTLATNACVEDKGGRAKLVLIGINPKTAAECGGEYGLPPAGDIWFLPSAGTMQGQILEEPDWDAFLRDSQAWFADADAVAVVELLAMWNNATLEKKARETILSRHSIPVICGHDLFSDLNSLQRASGTLLNARLLPVVGDFLKATKKALSERGIGAPVAIVRSDGSLMSERFTAVRPVETLLCGPAASLKGGMALAGEPDCIVIDMGGTTTDIAMVKNGAPVRAHEGIRIGKWKTFVKGVFIETFGLGGDSAVRLDRRRNLMLGPDRVIPLCAAAARWPGVTQRLSRLVEAVKTHTEPLHEFYCPVRDIKGDGRYTAAEQAFVAALADGPLILQQAGAAAGSSAYAIGMGRLEREGVVIRAGLTPTDIMHIRGDFSRYDRQAALLGAEFVAGCAGMAVEELCDNVYDLAKKTLYGSVVRILMDEKLPASRKNGVEKGLEALIERSWEESSGGESGFLEFSFRTKAALVGVGAPVHVFLPDVARALGACCVVPENAGVANALGAVVGNIAAESEIEIGVDWSVEGIRGYVIYGKEATVYAPELEEAIAIATAEAERDAVAQARLRGAAGDISVSSGVKLQQARTAEQAEVLLGARVTARATGGLAL